MLKKATINYTDTSGNEVSRTLTIKDVIFKYEEARVEIVYRSSPTDVDKAQLAGESFHSHSFPVDLDNPQDLDLILSASTRVWELSADVPLIEVPSLRDSRRVVSKKSISELGAVIEAIK